MSNKLKIDRKTNTIRVNIDGYAIRNVDGSIDFDGTINKFNNDLSNLVNDNQYNINKSFFPKSGSETAKSGIESEIRVVKSCFDWKNNGTALEIVGQLCALSSIDFFKVEDVKAYLWKDFPNITDKERKKKHKTDILILIKIIDEDDYKVYPISQKMATADFNQIDRRWVKEFKQILFMPNDIIHLLKFFTGELSPLEYELSAGKYDDRRIYIDEMSKLDQEKILSWFKNNIDAFLQFVFIGNELTYPPEYLLIEKVCQEGLYYKVAKIGDVINLYHSDVALSKPRATTGSSIYLGSHKRFESITVKRKGGDGGKKTANNLGASFSPLFVFDNLGVK